MAYYRATVNNHYPITSSNKGTPGLQFEMTIVEIKENGEFVPTQSPKSIVFQMYIVPGKSQEYAFKKLRHAGYTGGGLGSLNLVGKLVELSSKFEPYNGENQERFELALPPGEGGGPLERDDSAVDALDAMFASEGVETAGGSVSSGFDDGGSRAPVDVSNYDPEDEVPF